MNLNLLMRVFTNSNLLIGESYILDLNEKEGWIERTEDGEIIFAYTMDGTEITWNATSEEIVEALEDVGLI